MLIQRITTALIGITLLLLAITWGGQLLFLLIIMLSSSIALLEFYNMTLPQSRFMQMLGLALGLGLVWCVYIFSFHLSPSGNSGASTPAYLLIAVPTLVIFSLLIFQFMNYPRKVMRDEKITLMLFGILYICLFLSYLILLHQGSTGKRWIFFVLLVLWCGDSGAYISGRFLGRHALSPLVSPKKTLEGAMGGLILSLASAAAGQKLFFHDLTLGQSLLLALGISLAGLLGDLCESTLKRHSGIKDSGSLLPGHGGMLDRIDSLLFAAPLAYYYKVFILA